MAQRRKKPPSKKRNPPKKKPPAPELPEKFFITLEQYQNLVGWIENVPLPRAQTNGVVGLLQQIADQPAK